MMMENEQKEQRIGIDEEINKERYEQNSNVFLPYDILRFIFGYLNSMDLSSAAMVCRLWQIPAIDEKFSRGPHCFLGQYSFSTEGNYNFDCIKQSKIKPFLGFFFLHFSMCHVNVKDSICELLPRICKAIIIFADTIVINDKIYTLNEQDIICALLPPIPNVNIKEIDVITEIPGNTDDKFEEYTNIRIISQFDSMSEDSKTFYLHFMHVTDYWNEERITICFEKRKNAIPVNSEVPQMSLYPTYAPDSDKLSITGGVKMWSIVLHGCLIESIENELKKFKEQVKLQKHSLGFMFYSNKRVMKNMDLAIFKKLFPKVPLVGYHYYGVMREAARKTDLEKPKYETNVYYSESTFIILTYG